MTATHAHSQARLNELLRSVDWRFLLRRSELPRALDLRSGHGSEALSLVTRAASRAAGDADLVVLGYPTRRRLRAARAALAPGGEVVCIWWAPRPAAVRRARARMRRAGFADSRFYRPRAHARGQPERWLPLDAPEPIEQIPSGGDPPTRIGAARRRLRRVAERAGVLVPVYGVAGEGTAVALPDELAELLPTPDPWLLLTGGKESLNKVVGLPFAGDPSTLPPLVVKFARVESSDSFLRREAEILRQLARERPELRIYPRVRAVGRRAGRVALAQSAVYGQALDTVLSSRNLPHFATVMTRSLVDLAGSSAPEPASAWAPRLIWEPLERLQARFEGLLTPQDVAQAKELLGDLDRLPLVWVHRDCDPWNAVVGEDGGLTLLDWESAEPRGLPGQDLANFLLTAAYLTERAPAGATAGPVSALECHRRLLDPDTAVGRVSRECVAEYCASLDIEPELFPRLRLLCWLHQAVASWSATTTAPADGRAYDPFQASALVGLAQEELRRIF